MAISTNIKHHFEKNRVMYGGNSFPGTQVDLPVWEDYSHTGYPGPGNRDMHHDPSSFQRHYRSVPALGPQKQESSMFRPHSISPHHMSYGAPSAHGHGHEHEHSSPAGYNGPHSMSPGSEMDHPNDAYQGPLSAHLCSRSSFSPSPPPFPHLVGMGTRTDHGAGQPCLFNGHCYINCCECTYNDSIT
jgi:hypothetical protein